MAARHVLAKRCVDFRRGMRFALAAMICLTIAGQGIAAQPLSYLGFDEAGLSTEAAQGLQQILAGRLFNMSVPSAAVKMMLQVRGPFPEGSGIEPNSAEARFFALGMLPSSADRAVGADAAFGLGQSVFERNGAQMVTINCFMCHAGVVNGQVVAGLGNSHINQSDPRGARTRGDNFGPYEVWRMGARLDEPDKQGMALSANRTELQDLIDSLDLPPVDPMPWWLMKYKEWNYWYGDGGSHNAGNFSVNFTVPHPDMNARRAEHVGIVAQALAFARETQSPAFPGVLDADLVQRGADLFHGRKEPVAAEGFRACTNCHGTYTKRADQPDLSQPGGWEVEYDYSDTLRDVGTDASYNQVLRQLKSVAEHINKLAIYYEAQGQPELAARARVPATDGYVAPPLVGVWASAPYFHNGSAPTLEAVLDSSKRPEIWARNNRDPFAYDLVQVGMDYEPVTRSEFETSADAAKGKSFLAPAAIAHSTLYDTQAPGHGNMGHRFGDRLTPEERAAIIEFLKSLSGPNM